MSDVYPLIFCTIISKNYLPAARVLMDSLRAQHPEAGYVVLLVDKVDDYFNSADENFIILEAENLPIPHWPHFAFKYDIMELNTAVKPFFLAYLFEQYAAEKVIYLDPDIQAFSRMDDLLALLDRYTAVLTPHILNPLNDDRQPSEGDFLLTGTYNLGFFAISRRGAWRDILAWWQERLYFAGTREIERGLFVDQHWMELLPAFFEGVYILRDPAYNVAYWNMKQRNLEKEGETYLINGQKLRFMHFSGFSPDYPSVVSKHQNRLNFDDLNAHYKNCFQDYADALRDAGYDSCKHWPYVYGRFADGLPIPDPLRLCLREHDPYAERWPNPFDLNGADSFRVWAVESLAAGWRYLSPYALSFYHMQADLQRRYPALAGRDEAAFAAWFVQNAGAGGAFEAAYTQAIQTRLAQHPPPMINQSEKFALSTKLKLTLQFYQLYPKLIKPNLPKNALHNPPTLYTGPGGLYGALRKLLLRLGLQARLRRLIGLRLILTLRYFFTYPAPDLQALMRPEQPHDP